MERRDWPVLQSAKHPAEAAYATDLVGSSWLGWLRYRGAVYAGGHQTPPPTALDAPPACVGRGAPVRFPWPGGYAACAADDYALCSAHDCADCIAMDLRSYLDTLPLGGVAEFADRCGISTSYLQQLAAELPSASGSKRRPSPSLCVCMERESGGQLARQALRPEDYADIWPDLASTTTEG